MIRTLRALPRPAFAPFRTIAVAHSQRSYASTNTSASASTNSTSTMSTAPERNPAPPKALPNMPLIDAVKLRRSVYALTSSSPIADAEIVQLAKDTVLHVPSSFNSQTSRIVLLLKDQHVKFWDAVLEEHLTAAGDDEGKKERTKGRLQGFRAAYGTALFLESQQIIQNMQTATPAYASLFPEWSEHTTGMHQFVLWTALEAKGFGANLQHYQFVHSVKTRTREMFELPDDWDLKAQLVFGGVKEGGFPTEPKPKTSTDETVRVFGA